MRVQRDNGEPNTARGQEDAQHHRRDRSRSEANLGRAKDPRGNDPKKEAKGETDSLTQNIGREIEELLRVCVCLHYFCVYRNNYTWFLTVRRPTTPAVASHSRGRECVAWPGLRSSRGFTTGKYAETAE